MAVHAVDRGTEEAGVPGENSPTVRRRQLGILLRRRREQLGLTAQDVAAQLLVSPAKLSRLETGQRTPNQRDVRDLCDLYGITEPAERDVLMNLVDEARQPGWWHDLDLPTTPYVELEGAAERLSNWETALIPGLLQTSGYAEWALRSWDRRLTRTQVEDAARARRRRQERLTGIDPLELLAIFDESALHRMAGEPEMMREQVEHLLEVANLPRVSIQLLPYRAGLHEAVNSPFALLDFDATAYRRVVFVEGLVGYMYVDKADQILRYQAAFEWLRKTALSPADTVSHLIGLFHKIP